MQRSKDGTGWSSGVQRVEPQWSSGSVVQPAQPVEQFRVAKYRVVQRRTVQRSGRVRVCEVWSAVERGSVARWSRVDSVV